MSRSYGRTDGRSRRESIAAQLVVDLQHGEHVGLDSLFLAGSVGQGFIATKRRPLAVGLAHVVIGADAGEAFFAIGTGSC